MALHLAVCSRHSFSGTGLLTRYRFRHKVATDSGHFNDCVTVVGCLSPENRVYCGDSGPMMLWRALING